jgi:hypothetical protein
MKEVIVFAPDLMDRSRITAALPQARFVRTVDELSAAPAASVVVVDLGRPGVLDMIPNVAAPVIGFASHVDDALIHAGRAAGCVEVLARSRFFRRLSDLAREQSEQDG